MLSRFDHKSLAWKLTTAGSGRIFRPESPEDVVSGTVELTEIRRRGYLIDLFFTTETNRWIEFERRGSTRMRFEGSTDRGCVEWHADVSLTSSPHSRDAEQSRLSFFVSELREREIRRKSGPDRSNRIFLTAGLSRGALLPSPPKHTAFHTTLKLESYIEPIALKDSEGTINLETRYLGSTAEPSVPTLLIDDRVFADFEPTVAADANDDSACESLLDALRERADDLAFALSFLSAQYVRTTHFECLRESSDRFVKDRIIRWVDPPAKLPGSHPVCSRDQLADMLPPVYETLRKRDSEAMRRAIDQFAGLATDKLVMDRLRHGVVCLDILGKAFGQSELVPRGESKPFRVAMMDAVAALGASSEVQEAVREGINHVFSRNFRKSIESMLKTLDVPHRDLFPNGFKTLVGCRNDIQHEGYIKAETATVDEWAVLASPLAVLVARIILRACGVAPGRAGIWRDLVRPAGW